MNSSATPTKRTNSKPAKIDTGTFAGYFGKVMTGNRVAIGKAPAKGRAFVPFAIVHGDSTRWVNRAHFQKLVDNGKARVTPVEHFTA